MSQDKLNSTDRVVGGIENYDGNLRASAAISAGEPVEFDGTETGNVPDVSAVGTQGNPIAGVAMVDASSSGDSVSVAQTGAEVRTNASGATAPSVGDQLVAAANGSVIRVAEATTGDAIVGVAKTSESGQGEVVMLVDLGGEVN